MGTAYARGGWGSHGAMGHQLHSLRAEVLGLAAIHRDRSLRIGRQAERRGGRTAGGHGGVDLDDQVQVAALQVHGEGVRGGGRTLQVDHVADR
jgi:hypothetical protein